MSNLPPRRPGALARFDTISFGAGIVEKIVTNWATVVQYIGGGTLMGYLAYLQQVPPLVWGFAFFGGFFLVGGVRALTRWGRKQEALGRLYDATAVKTGPFNRLEGEFIRKQISISDMISPLGEPLQNKTFVECEFHGPGLMMCSGCTIDGFGGGHVELIKLHSERALMLPNKASLVRCHFTRCTFYNVALAMRDKSVDELRQKIKDNGGAIAVMGE